MALLPYQAQTLHVENPNDNSSQIQEVEDILDEYLRKQQFSNYEVAREVIKELTADWLEEIERTHARRNTRYFRLDVEREKDNGNLNQDELFIPVSLCNTNIIRAQAKHAQYLTQSQRSAILSCNEDGSVDTTLLEKDFTKRCRYNAWELPLLKFIDGTETHAWDFVEILFDKTKPGHYFIEHCGHENVLFPLDTKDFQSAPYFVRIIEYTAGDLIKFVKERKWNKEQVVKLLGAGEQKNKKDIKASSTYKVEKFFFRGEDDFIYVGWSNHEHCDGWLREPKPLYLGKVDINPNPIQPDGSDRFINLYETAYPVEPYLYSISENETISELKGRVDLDEAKQEAATSLLSSFCTSYRRAAEPYFSVDGVNDGADIEEAVTNIKLHPGQVFKKGLKAFQLTTPDIGMLSAINTLIGQSQMESGDVNYAVQSNKSTRKTAAEINLAQSESQLLSGVQVTLLSIALRNVYTRCFDIYSSRVLAGLIKVPQNVYDLLSRYTFTLKPAGDVDVIERQQKIALMQQSWPVYQNTPAAKRFLINLTKLLFPDDAEQYIREFEVDDAKDQFIIGIVNNLKQLTTDPATGQIRPELAMFAPMLQQLEQQATQLIQMNHIQNNEGELNTPDNVHELNELSNQQQGMM